MRNIKHCLLLLMFVISCSESADEIVSLESSLRSDTLAVVCEIGELMGDSLYVFGEITSAEPVPEGVAVLDIHSCRISFFNRQGEFIRSVGGSGEGPGEFQLPIDFAVLKDGRIAVADLIGRKIDILSSDGELLNSLSTEHQILPYRMDALTDSTFMIYYYRTQNVGEILNLGYALEIWNTSGFQRELWSYNKDYDGSEFQFAPGYIQCCFGGGSVFLSYMDDPAFSITRISIPGMDSTSITGESISVTADTSDTGYDELHTYLRFNYGDMLVDLESEPLEMRPQISAMGVDSRDILWVKLGTSDSEEWLLFSSDNELVGSGSITGIAEPGRLRYAVNDHGAVAWAPYTEEYPVLYILGEAAAVSPLNQGFR